MKKLLTVLAALLLSFGSANAIVYETDTITREAKIQQNISEVAFKILNGSHVDKIIPAYYEPSKKGVNAYADITKSIHIQKGIIRFIENDDELAAVIAHEIAHAIELHKNFYQIVPMSLNSKAYEFQADKKAIDLMANAGYNPLALITLYSKAFPQRYIDWVPLFCSHPKTSRRLATIYDQIYMKYPKYLANNEYKDNIYYQNFLLTSKENRKRFEIKAKNPSVTRVRYK